jgi:hypothetical protein
MNEFEKGYIKIANRSFENVAQLKYLGTTVTNQNLIQEEGGVGRAGIIHVHNHYQWVEDNPRDLLLSTRH